MIGLMLVILLGLLIPLFIPISGEVGLNEPNDLLSENDSIVTIPFSGTDGLDIYYEYRLNEEKQDKNFILIHGSLYNSKTWSEVMDYFATKGNVYAYDQLPYGYSEKILEGDWTEDNPYTVDATLEQLIAFMDELDIDSATMVGSSYGGVIAAEAAIAFESRVDALILVDPAILVNESMPLWLVDSPQVEHLGPILAKSLSSGDTFYESTFYDKDKLTAERMALNKRETHINNWNLALWEYLQAWSVEPSDVATRLNDINQSVLVISGEQDEIVAIEDSIEISDRIRNSTFVMIEDCGHLPHEEKPEEFISIVDEWKYQ